MRTTIAVLIATTTGTATATPLAVCTDGGEFTGARVSADASTIRYCIDDACWSFAPATHSLVPITAAAAHADHPGDTAIAHHERYDAPENPPVPTWRASYTDNTDVEVCGPDGCAPFPIVRFKGKDRPDSDYVAAAEISDSGARVAIARGLEMLTKEMPVEIYDRASHKRLGVVHTKLQCTRIIGFAGESTVVQEWGCANQGGPRDIISPAGKAIAHLDGSFVNADEFVRVDGDRWAFLNPDQGYALIYDVVTGKRIGRVVIGHEGVTAVAGKLYAFDTTGKLDIYDRDGRLLATTAPPTCRWTWEAETIGKLRFSMTGPELAKQLGAPRKTSKPDADRKVTVSFGNGLSIKLQTYDQSGAHDPCGPGPQPAQIVEIDVTAPSTLATGSGITIGSAVATLDATYGAHFIAARSTATTRVYSNDATEPGWTFDIVDGKVAAIHVGKP